MRYEIGICIATGWICWINGPFPSGFGNDRDIAELSLHHMLGDGEGYIADGVYRRIMGVARTPTGNHRYSDRKEQEARARHETVNSLLKNFGCLGNRFRHDREDHYFFFAPCALMVQLMLEDGRGTFQVTYDERLFDDR